VPSAAPQDTQATGQLSDLHLGASDKKAWDNGRVFTLGN
jgi:hypothetical protein